MGLTLWRKDETQEATRIPTEDLNTALEELVKYGHPRVSHLKGGWYCTVNMNTDTIGAKFDIDSGFDHPSPIAALKECRERIEKALKQLGTT